MKFCAKITGVNEPLKIYAVDESLLTDETQYSVCVSFSDCKKFINDISALFQSQLVGVQDRLVGVIFHEDRTLYCGKKKVWMQKLEFFKTVPFVIELIRVNEKVYLNQMPVSEVRKIMGRTIYALPYGDIELDYLFPES